MRVDYYASIHKAMRSLLTDTLLAVGRMDTSEVAELVEMGGRVLVMLDFCVGHLGHENTFVHAAIEARAPGASVLLPCGSPTQVPPRWGLVQVPTPT